MIIEAVVSTTNADGSVNLAPMGPRIDNNWSTFELRPFDSSTTYANLKRTREGILHITDDVGLIARSAIGQLTELPAMQPGKFVKALAISDSCRWYEFRVELITETLPRISMICHTVFEHCQRDFIGFNRAKHAVLEAAILATRVSFLSFNEIEEQFRRFETIVEKTGGDYEMETFRLLQQFVRQAHLDSVAISSTSQF